MKKLSLALCLALLTSCGPSSSKQVATVTLSRDCRPAKPLASQYMKIAVMNAQMSGDTTEFDESKWSKMTADLIQHNLEQAADHNNIPIKLVDREHIKLAMGEKDLAAAGVTNSGDNMAAAKIEGASAILTSKVTIKIDKQKGHARTVDALGAFGSAWGGGGGVSTSETEKESRNITVTCQFQLKDPGTNEIICSYNGRPDQHYDKARGGSPVFGSGKTEADMTPRDKVIGQIIERQADEFLAKIVPVHIEATVQVKPGSSDASVAGVRAMVVDDYQTALTHLKQALAEKPDDHESNFAAGVCCEKLNQMDEARKYYKVAQSLKPKEEKYSDAVNRVSAM
ncbi:MAG TPA: tetratricopeptide repeat protein [Phycisphaerae bacterium]|nr:tetratricopeptide repeat protein [Phycisphaerae bacterium]